MQHSRKDIELLCSYSYNRTTTKLSVKKRVMLHFCIISNALLLEEEWVEHPRGPSKTAAQKLLAAFQMQFSIEAQRRAEM